MIHTSKTRDGLSWHCRYSRLLVVITVLAMSLALMAVPALGADGPQAQVIVQKAPGAGDAPERLIDDLGGEVLFDLGLIDGFAALLPAEAIPLLRAHPAIAAVTPDSQIVLLETDDECDDDEKCHDEFDDDEYDWGVTYANQSGSMYNVVREIGADRMWEHGILGDGVDVALIDSGVVPVAGLTTNGKVINGPDLSFESQAENLIYLDTYGHGTHMGGIIAGSDPVDYNPAKYDDSKFFGVAPGARVLSVKVADAQGAADVSQVIAAIDWVIQHRNDNGMNVRVINLSFGTDSDQSYLLDPLAFAAEQAWLQGIVVVVAAGNDGNGSPLRNPAIDPFVITVGATDGDAVADFSSCGTEGRFIDVLAPGRSIVALRSPNSRADTEHPEARVADGYAYSYRYFKGSGTSQSAAVVSGAVALLLDQRPDLTPDQVKALLMATADGVKAESKLCHGAGQIDLGAAMSASPTKASQSHQPSNGTGTLEGARGSDHLYDEDVPLEGEIDIFGQPWNGELHAKLVMNGSSWSAGTWNGSSWSGSSWSGSSWSGSSWSGSSWSGSSWSGSSWSSKSWSGASWSGSSWSGSSWSGSSWSGSSWSGDVWHGLSWN